MSWANPNAMLPAQFHHQQRPQQRPQTAAPTGHMPQLAGASSAPLAAASMPPPPLAAASMPPPQPQRIDGIKVDEMYDLGWAEGSAEEQKKRCEACYTSGVKEQLVTLMGRPCGPGSPGKNEYDTLLKSEDYVLGMRMGDHKGFDKGFNSGVEVMGTNLTAFYEKQLRSEPADKRQRTM